MPTRSTPPVTIGIDLAAQPARTAACRVTWFSNRLDVEFLDDTGDDGLLTLMRSGPKVGLDCPLGWPIDFVELVSAHTRGERLPPRARRSGLSQLSYRFTDNVFWNFGVGGRPPLSVATDLLGVVALRAAGLLNELAATGVEVDRSGVIGPVAEVYPAATARAWGLVQKQSYKKASATDVRAGMIEILQNDLGFELSEDVTSRCVRSHDDLDALLCALIARAVELGFSSPPEGDEQYRLAGIEGWIHVPTCHVTDLLPIVPSG